MRDTRERILDVAIEVLGQRPEAGMGDVAAAAGVVRRTVYGHFPSRSDLVLALTRRAVGQMTAVLDEAAAGEGPADEAWADFVARLWPLVGRYRVLVVLRRGEHGPEIHALLGPVEEALSALVARGQDDGSFGRHLSAGVLSRVAWSAIFTIADADVDGSPPDVGGVTTASLLLLGVPAARAESLTGRRPR